MNAWEAPTQISKWKEEHVRPKLCLSVTDPSLHYAWVVQEVVCAICSMCMLCSPVLCSQARYWASQCAYSCALPVVRGCYFRIPFHQQWICSQTRSVCTQIVFLVLGSWGVGIYTAIKVFGGKKKEPAAAAA